MLQRVKASPNVPFYWVILEAASLLWKVAISYPWHAAIAGLEKGVARAPDSMNRGGYLSSSNHFSLGGDLENMEPKETTRTSIQDRNPQGLPDPTVSAHYTTMYLARVSIKG